VFKEPNRGLEFVHSILIPGVLATVSKYTCRKVTLIKNFPSNLSLLPVREKATQSPRILPLPSQEFDCRSLLHRSFQASIPDLGIGPAATLILANGFNRCTLHAPSLISPTPWPAQTQHRAANPPHYSDLLILYPPVCPGEKLVESKLHYCCWYCIT